MFALTAIQDIMKTIFLIAGHNGPGTGANGLLDEGKETIRFRDMLEAELCKLGILPQTERERDGDELPKVVAWLKRTAKKEDVCIDIHFNAAQASAEGTEVFVPSAPTDFEKDLADCLCRGICSVLGTRNRGVKKESQSDRGKLAMLSGFDCHQVLVEICFCTNTGDVQKYNDNKFQLAARMAQIIANRI